MNKLLASIKKDLLLLTRDKVGLIFMFGMPIVLAILISAVQNSTFDLVNNNKVTLLLQNTDTGLCSKQFIEQIKKAGIFETNEKIEFSGYENFGDQMKKADALIGIRIPRDFSHKIMSRSEFIANQILIDLGVSSDSSRNRMQLSESNIELYFNPVLQESFRYSVRGAVNGALQLTENKQMLARLYSHFSEHSSPDSLEQLIQKVQTGLKEKTISKNGVVTIPNATQHNIPAWTLFAMFFVVISLGSNIVNEKTNGSFLRLRTLPSSYVISLVSKQITYLVVTFLQAFLIFMIGVFLFPLMHLPKLVLPSNLISLFCVTLLSGWCAVSFAMCVGIFARTTEQSNGFGAVTVVILAAIGGILVPSFAMPDSFGLLLNLSPLHWCLESYYMLFLQNGSFADIISSILPIILMIVFLHLLAYLGLKQKQLI